MGGQDVDEWILEFSEFWIKGNSVKLPEGFSHTGFPKKLVFQVEMSLHVTVRFPGVFFILSGQSWKSDLKSESDLNEKVPRKRQGIEIKKAIVLMKL